MLLALLLLTSGVAAQVADLAASDAELAADQEPITPIPPAPEAAPLKVALGERLFEDPRLSRDRTRACSTCHATRTNGADANRRDKAIDGSELPLNTPTIFNAALSFRLNWEGNFSSLEAQAESSLDGPVMGIAVDDVVGRLRADAELTDRFREAYGRDPDRSNLLDAIATYERSLLTPGGRFDRWLAGDAGALSTEERRGYRLFKQFGCISCHQGVNVGGNLFERHGIFQPLASPKPEILRVPSLRNVAATPPYFHDGSAPTLDDAVRRMGAAQLNRMLTDEQVELVVAFLSTLSGTYHGARVTGASP
jgi:cytochrome c peroxidase